MINTTFLPAIFLILGLLSPPASEAVLIELTEADVKEAIKYGRDNKDAGYLEFFKDWRVDWGYGTGAARIITAFSKIAFEAKNSPSDDVGPGPEDIEEILKELKGRLAFGVSIYGETRDFAQDASAVLIFEEETIQPVESKPDMKAEPTDSWPNPPAYRAICYFYFDANKVDPNGIVALVVRVPGQQDVRFPFDLSGMK